jgi:hypothetical protein
MFQTKVVEKSSLSLPQLSFQFSPPKPCLYLFFPLHRVFRATVHGSDFNDYGNLTILFSIVGHPKRGHPWAYGSD